jgi:hypothetical protein
MVNMNNAANVVNESETASGRMGVPANGEE